jgi:hypothetical protein
MNDTSFSLLPISFLELKLDCRFLKGTDLPSRGYKLQDTSYLLDQEPFAEISMGWNFEGLYFLIDAKTRKIRSSYPDLTSGDSFEVMIDTRNVKSALTTKFCHHFFFLAEPVEELICGEKTRFRTDEGHEMAQEEFFGVDTKKTLQGYQMRVFIPKKALFGFEADSLEEIGFNYRLNRFSGPPQELSASSKEFSVEQHPSLWSHLILVRHVN